MTDPADAYLPLADTADFAQRVGQRVAVVGRISREPWQHMIADVPSHPHAHYFDDLTGDQIVIYAEESIEAEGAIRVRGQVYEVAGRSKRPGSTDRYVEYHLTVDAWEPAE